MVESLLKAEDLSLNKYLLLSNENFKIPYTQRPYEWNNSQVERLFYDIVAVHEGRKQQHILNFITIYKDDGFQNIYDGQQRTVTLLIIMCAIINKIKDLGNDELAGQIREEFIKKESWRSSSENDVKITFANKETNDFFDHYVINGNPINSDFENTDKEKRLKANYDLVNKLVNQYVKENNIDANGLGMMIESMTDKVYVIVLHTPNEDIANQMFETLNNTGKKIANFYVLKNACVKVISEEETAKYWNNIESNLDSLNKNNFLSQYVSMLNGKTSVQQALSVLENKGYLSNQEEVKNLLSEMEKTSQYYLELHEPEQRRRRNENKVDVDRYIRLVDALNIFKSKQYRPVILAMNVKQYDINDINRVLNKCLSIQIRNFFIAQHKANTVEHFYPDLAKDTYENKNIITEEILDRLNKKVITDIEVRSLLKTRKIKKRESKPARYLLKRIYDFENDREIEVNSNTKHVNLEHILPQNPKEDSAWRYHF